MIPVVRHATSLRRAAAVGSPVEFYLETFTYDEVTYTHSDEQMEIVSGHGVEFDSDPEEYADLTLTLREPLTLLFITNKIGERPQLESTFIWDEENRVVKRLKLFRPGGIVIGCKVLAL